MRARINIPIRLFLVLSALICYGPAAAAERSLPPPGECPQPRFTEKAPPDILKLANPLSASAETLAAGQRFYRGNSGAIPVPPATVKRATAKASWRRSLCLRRAISRARKPSTTFLTDSYSGSSRTARRAPLCRPPAHSAISLTRTSGSSWPIYGFWRGSPAGAFWRRHAHRLDWQEP